MPPRPPAAPAPKPVVPPDPRPKPVPEVVKPISLPEFEDLSDFEELPEYRAPSAPVQAPRAPVFEAIEADEIIDLGQLPRLEDLHSLDEGTAMVSDDDIRRLLAAGLGEAEVTVRLNTTYARVSAVKSGGGIHTTLVTQSGSSVGSTFVLSDKDAPLDIANPRQVFMRSLVDFQECLQIAMTEYRNNPDSETNHAAMNGFMKTIDGMYKSMDKMGGTKEKAEKVVTGLVAPYINALDRAVVQVLISLREDLAPTLPNAFQKEQLTDSLRTAMKLFRTRTRDEYNRAVKTLADLLETDLDHKLMKPAPVSGELQ